MVCDDEFYETIARDFFHNRPEWLLKQGLIAALQSGFFS